MRELYVRWHSDWLGLIPTGFRILREQRWLSAKRGQVAGLGYLFCCIHERIIPRASIVFVSNAPDNNIIPGCSPPRGHKPGLYLYRRTWIFPKRAIYRTFREPTRSNLLLYVGNCKIIFERLRSGGKTLRKIISSDYPGNECLKRLLRLDIFASSTKTPRTSSSSFEILRLTFKKCKSMNDVYPYLWKIFKNLVSQYVVYLIKTFNIR